MPQLLQVSKHAVKEVDISKWCDSRKCTQIFKRVTEQGGSCRNSIGVNFGVTPKLERIYHEFEKKNPTEKKIYLLPKTFVLHNIMIFEFL